MRFRNTVTLVAGLFLIATTVRPVASQQPDGLGALSWLAGCWQQRNGARVTDEQWMAPAGSVMLGMSRTVADGVVRETEQLRIEVRDGKPTYVASPSGQATTAFTAVDATATGVTFENLAHDFPKRIRYRRVGTDSLVATIEGPRGGRDVAINFPMRRVSCGA